MSPARERIKQFIAEVIDTADWHEYPRRRAIARDAVALFLWYKGHGLDNKGILIQKIIDRFEEEHVEWSEKAMDLAKKRVIPIVVSIMLDKIKDLPHDDVAVLGEKAVAFLK